MPKKLIDDLGIMENKRSFSQAFDFTLGAEGGKTVDHAGATNHGVTQDTFNNYRNQKGLWKKSVYQITPAEVEDLYKTEYFQKPGLNNLPDRTAGVLFDFGVNAGTGKAVKTLQAAVGVKPDGQIGAKTVGAVKDFIDAYGEDTLLVKLLDDRQAHYDELVKMNTAKYGKFKNGWANRVNNLKKYYKIG